MLMTVIRFVMPLQDHTIKKLLLIFWEVVPKYSQDGKMLQEIILVCDAYRKVRYLFSLLAVHASCKRNLCGERGMGKALQEYSMLSI